MTYHARPAVTTLYARTNADLATRSGSRVLLRH